MLNPSPPDFLLGSGVRPITSEPHKTSGSPQTCDPSHPQSAPTANSPPATPTSRPRIANFVPPSPRTTSLESRESNAHFRQDLRYEALRHARWHDVRDKTITMLEHNGTGSTSLTRFKDCGKAAFVYQHNDCPTLVRIRCDKCRHRLCQPCQHERGNIIRHNLEKLAFTAGKRLKMLTLTLKHSTRPLRAQLDHLVASFREFRRLRIWTKAVKAAAWVIEITLGLDGLWHPHIHCLIDGNYMGVGWLTQAWLACTGTSTQVHIMAISAHNGARYISKYVGKTCSNNVYEQPGRYEEYATAMKGRRICSTLGAWRKCPLAESEADEELLGTKLPMGAAHWHSIGSFDEFVSRSHAGDPAAREVLHLIIYGSRSDDIPKSKPHPPPIPFELRPERQPDWTLF